MSNEYITDDPIARKLIEHWEEASKIYEKKIKQLQHTLWLTERARTSDEPDTLEQRNDKMMSEEPMAQYDNWDFLHSDDPWALNLMNTLGLRPEQTSKVTVILEQGNPIRIFTEQFAPPHEEQGATWKRK